MRGIKAEISAAEDGPSDDVPAPEWLSDDGAEVWREQLPLLNQRGTLSVADLKIFANFCEACATVVMTSRTLKKEGLTFTGPSGPKKHPAVAIRDAAMNQARQMAAELGLTPASRGRPGIKGGEGGQGDLFSL
jgi:P27 family predicted phage terminase small subunit